MARKSYLSRVLGHETCQKIECSKVLMVGTGGIGCELLKDLILMSFGEIHILDLDTIDLSNLNRQFLFTKNDIGKPKSFTAAKNVERFNFNSDKCKIIPYFGSILDTSVFPIEWFQQFDIIFNALDNLEARRYVNKVSLITGIPLIETGTMGFLGQVQPIIPYKSECFDCNPKQTPKSFPVCTIRSTPSQPVHCVVWAKNYLFSKLFSKDEDEEKDDETPEGTTEVVGEDGVDEQKEIENMKKDSKELDKIKSKYLSMGSEDTLFVKFSEAVFNKCFTRDIEKLLQLDSLWKTRAAPRVLNIWDLLKEANDKLVVGASDDSGNKLDIEIFDSMLPGIYSKSNEVWTLSECVLVFMDSLRKLVNRLQSSSEEISFDKDDDDTLRFVGSTALIRSYIFHIPIKSLFDIKQIAGNIIPAITTTNAIIAAFSSIQSIPLLSGDAGVKQKLIYLAKSTSSLVSSSNLSEPQSSCPSCTNRYSIAKISPDVTVKSLLASLEKSTPYDTEELAIQYNSSIIYDPDFDDNLEKKLVDLGIKNRSYLYIVDESDTFSNLELYLTFDESLKESEIQLQDVEIPKRPLTESENDSEAANESLISVSGKRSIDEVEGIENGNSKRSKTEDNGVLVIDDDDDIPEIL